MGNPLDVSSRTEGRADDRSRGRFRSSPLRGAQTAQAVARLSLRALDEVSLNSMIKNDENNNQKLHT